MLSRIIKRNILTTKNFRCISKGEKVPCAVEAPPDSKEAKVKELLENSAAFVDTKPQSAEDQWATLPYVEGTVFNPRDQNRHFERTKVDPADTSVILFPGQGSQFVGMAKNLIKFPQAKDLFELASEVLRYDLLKLCLEGPEDKLNETKYCQPAVMVTSLAALEQLKEERPNAIDACLATAGFSLGEITSLIFAGAIPFDKGVRLVQIRGEAMQKACEEFDGGMATVLLQPDSQLGYALKSAKEWCVERGVDNPECVAANHLFPQCKVISGSKEALRYIEQNLKKFKLKRMKKIPTYGAFHTSLMQSAVEPFAQALKKIHIEDPVIGVYSNVDGKRYRHAGHILRQLPQQIVKPVKWEQTMHIFYDRNKDIKQPRTFICGPGDALRTILRMVNASAWDTSYKYGD